MPNPLALTMGEPAGIGAEITVKAWQHLRQHAAWPGFFVIDHPERYDALNVPIVTIDEPAQTCAAFQEHLPILPLDKPASSTPGRASPATAPSVIASIEHAVAYCLDGSASGIVTNPIEKHILIDAGFCFPGHTEFLGQLTKHIPMTSPRGPVMMLAGPTLRTVPVTVHQALSTVPASLTADNIISIALITNAALISDFGIKAPRLVIAGLNPHAGEQGLFGCEDDTVIAPAVQALRQQGINATGPLPADTLFHAEKRAGYDAALCMYHDQALIPVKTLDFHHTVNVTLGLPIVRTSPDHGTALDIAGQGLANPASLISALMMAAQIASTRTQAYP